MSKNGFGLTMRVKDAFFDRAYVRDRLDIASHKVLSKFGAYVRRDARRSIRPAAQKSLGELTTEQRERHNLAVARAKVMGWRKPKRPMRHSKPGEPPRSINGLLKKFIFFSWDNSSRTVVIGPVKLNKRGSVPELLEYGGIGQLRNGRSARYAPRPYMGPAFDKNEPKLPQMWQDVVK